jgi:hypothetical protein
VRIFRYLAQWVYHGVFVEAGIGKELREANGQARASVR